jgi:hypothetical protein
MKTKLLKGRIDYDGAQLSSLWAYRGHGLQGDSILAFQGACDVPVEKLVDAEDALAGAFIWSPLMLHFIVEHFELDLEAAILRQYLLVSTAQDELMRRQKRRVTRSGNDLYLGQAKLSVSIATLTPVSSKIHFGINILSKGTPVKTLGLKDLGIEPLAFARELLRRYADDCARMARARTKVKGVI